MKKLITPTFVIAIAMACAPMCCRGPGAPDQITAGDLTFEIDERDKQCRPISPLIYGTNSSERPSTFPFRRIGGEAWSTYNWETNTRAHQGNIARVEQGAGSPAAGGAIAYRSDTHVNAGERMLITVPMLDDVAGPIVGEVANTDGIATTAELASRFKRSIVQKPGAPETLTLSPQLNDESVYQDEFVYWVKDHFGATRVDTSNGSIFFALDNEPDLWNGAFSHRLVHPQQPRYDEIIPNSIRLARSIKGQAPNAFVFGPVLSGWNGILNLGEAPDAPAGKELFVSTYLTAMKQASDTAGYRLLDVLDVHWYPEARFYLNEEKTGPIYKVVDEESEINTTGLTNEQKTALFEALREKRRHAPRALWDRSYDEQDWVKGTVEQGWIKRTLYDDDAFGRNVALLPRLKSYINQYYGETKLAVTEYYFGGRKDMSGAIAQADALGIFGREDVFAAALWEWRLHPETEADHHPYSHIYAAFEMYRNYDGSGSQFGPLSCPSTTSDSARSSIYASTGAPGRVVAVAINRDGVDRIAAVRIRSCSCYQEYGAYRLAEEPNPPRPKTANDLILEAKMNAVRVKVPAYSVVTIVAHRKTAGPTNWFNMSGCRNW